MRPPAALALWLVVSLVAAPGRGLAGPNPSERKSSPAIRSAPIKPVTLAGKPPATKPLPRRPVPPSRRQATPASPPLPHPVAVAAFNSPPRLDRTASGAAPRLGIEARIAAAREVYQAGRYAEVPTALIKLLSESQLTPSQLAAVYELLASAYVALGQTELAIRCFSEVLSRRPAFALDPVRTSPKIRAALDQARTTATGAPAAQPATRRPM